MQGSQIPRSSAQIFVHWIFILITVLHPCHLFKGLRRNKDQEIQSPALFDIADNGSWQPQFLHWLKATRKDMATFVFMKNNG
jgi:hypothetical protein